ncbi:hypothetical protein H310_09555 [Aphanomyces invadans]|uniref:Uncharacterized protein n=1 Tax=Aphanomyces invadans TaxID=157072 RepID=A0A024TWC1_9STRA|nr:hypothetical protein H310_09555 [Aphanomyces invadans]ETV97667.1 hypothetical protein H310_09555 [Aphanomyces invadans]|eukprot:XP_008873876.1 hypothetical protein H310_09555 [Aphanomyces invadans]
MANGSVRAAGTTAGIHGYAVATGYEFVGDAVVIDESEHSLADGDDTPALELSSVVVSLKSCGNTSFLNRGKSSKMSMSSSMVGWVDEGGAPSNRHAMSSSIRIISKCAVSMAAVVRGTSRMRKCHAGIARFRLGRV